MSEIDKLLGDFDTRKQDEKDARAVKAAKDKQLREESIAILESIVLPALKSLSEAIVAKGHRAEVREHFINYTHPSVGLVFSPILPDQTSRSPESTIHFMHTESGQIKIKQEVRSPNGRDRSDYATNGEWKLSEVSQDKVKERTVQFIEAVLKVS